MEDAAATQGPGSWGADPGAPRHPTAAGVGLPCRCVVGSSGPHAAQALGERGGRGLDTGLRAAIRRRNVSVCLPRCPGGDQSGRVP